MSKYGARPTVLAGRRFDSAAEARRYQQLCLLAQAGEVSDVECQPRYPLHVNGQRLGVYVADFRYRDLMTGATVVEDVKGVRTPIYRWKARHLLAEYGIAVVEVPASS